jgi:hypothetical protein
VTARLDTNPAEPHDPSHPNAIVDIADAAEDRARRYDASNGMTKFLSRYGEAQEFSRRAAEAETRKARAKTTIPNSTPGPLFETRAERIQREDREDQAQYFGEIHAYEHTAVKERLKNGFQHHFAMEVGGRHREPFTEFGLRSETLKSVAGRYFVSCVPRRGRLRGSMDKATLAVQARSKLLSLDYPWIEANKQMLSVIRIDCDRVFDSPEHCLAELRELVGHKIPCLPHLVTGDLLPDGRYSRPHMYFLLPQGHAVWNEPTDPRCRMSIVKMFQAVSLGLTKALLDLGADPCAPTLTLRGKNPLSPYWHTLTPNDGCWPTLSDYAGWVEMCVSREILVRQAAAIQAENGIEGSNSYFNGLRKEAFRLLREWHFSSDPRGHGEKGRIADELHLALIRQIAESDSGLTEIQAELLVAKVADYAVGTWDVSKVETIRKARGRLLHVTEGMTTVSKRQAAGAAYAAAAKADRALGLLVEAYGKLRDEGLPINQTSVSARAGIHRRTAIRRWSEVLAAVELDPAPLDEAESDNRCIDKKAATTSAILFCQSGPEEDGPSAAVEPDRATMTVVPTDDAAIMIAPFPQSTAAIPGLAPESYTAIPPSEASSNRRKPPVETIEADLWATSHEDDDMAEIEAQEAWLASSETEAACDDPEPDEEWFAGVSSRGDSARRTCRPGQA